MSEIRTPYGIPVPGALDRLDPISPLQGQDLEPIQPRDYADEEPDTWREELPDGERLTYDAILARVRRAVAWRVSPEDSVWLVEETLYQLSLLWRDLTPHALEIPGIGTVRRGIDGRPLGTERRP
jgi:hypothetical protein